MKDESQSVVVPYVKMNDKCTTESSALVSTSSLVDSEYYSIRTKVACSIWLEKNTENSKMMLARFLR